MVGLHVSEFSLVRWHWSNFWVQSCRYQQSFWAV